MSENRKPAPSKNQIEKLKSLVDDAYAAVRKAEEYATETGQSFSFNIAYGMGGYFTPSTSEDYNESYSEAGWSSSSSNC